MRYLIRVNELEEKSNYFEEQVNIINENIKKIESIKKDIVWEGEAKEKFMDKYDEYVISLKDMVKNLIKIVLYLKSYSSNYSDEYQKMKEKYTNLLDGVNVNELY